MKALEIPVTYFIVLWIIFLAYCRFRLTYAVSVRCRHGESCLGTRHRIFVPVLRGGDNPTWGFPRICVLSCLLVLLMLDWLLESLRREYITLSSLARYPLH